MTSNDKLVLNLRYLGRVGRNALNTIAPTCILADLTTPSGEIRWRFVTDCGLMPAGDGQTLLPNFNALKDGKKIDAVFITHLHTDHVGALPRLLPYLATQARIFLSDPTWAMLEHVLDDCIKVSRSQGQEIYN